MIGLRSDLVSASTQWSNFKMTTTDDAIQDINGDIAKAAEYFEQGKQAEASGNRLEAITCYEEAYDINSDDREISFRLAYNLDLVGEEESALGFTKRSVSSHPHRSMPWSISPCFTRTEVDYHRLNVVSNRFWPFPKNGRPQRMGNVNVSGFPRSIPMSS